MAIENDVIPNLIKTKNTIYYKGVVIRNSKFRNITKTYTKYINIDGFMELTIQILDMYIEGNDITALWNRRKRIMNMFDLNNIRKYDDNGKIISWNKGLTKHTHASVMKMSTDRMGVNNPSHKIKDRVQWANNVSNGIKKSILSGKYTPKSNNRLTHKETSYKGINYRSSWECVWAYFNENHLYEKIRISYLDEHGSNRTTIVDFFDSIDRILYEIKPTKILNNENTQYKIKGIRHYCEKHGIEFIIISEKEIYELCVKIKDYSNFNDNATKLIKTYIKRVENENKKNN